MSSYQCPLSCIKNSAPSCECEQNLVRINIIHVKFIVKRCILISPLWFVDISVWYLISLQDLWRVCKWRYKRTLPLPLKFLRGHFLSCSLFSAPTYSIIVKIMSMERGALKGFDCYLILLQISFRIERLEFIQYIFTALCNECIERSSCSKCDTCLGPRYYAAPILWKASDEKTSLSSSVSLQYSYLMFPLPSSSLSICASASTDLWRYINVLLLLLSFTASSVLSDA
jgi:hypothetical protein